jgi:hypothetical protein
VRSVTFLLKQCNFIRNRNWKLYEGGPKYFQNLNLPHKQDIGQDSATRYGQPHSELVCQVTLYCVLCVIISGIFSKCLQVCLAIFLKTE